MITPLRRRHRWLAPLAFGLALVGLGLGLSERPTEFVRSARASARVGAANAPRVTSSDGRFAVALEKGAPGLDRLWLLPAEPLDAPDLLAYAAGPTPAGGALPGDAVLLGVLSSTEPSFVGVERLPRTLVLYSLGHAEVKGVVDLTELGAR